MKIVYTTLLFVLFFAFGLGAQTIWDNFEDTRKGTYGFISGTFIPYFENPDPSGVNNSQVAASYNRNPGELFDVIILDGQMADLSDYLVGAKTLSIDVWSPAPGRTVQITLENSILAEPANFPTGRHSVYLATTSTSMAWETLTFAFDNQPDALMANDNVDRIVLLFDPNTYNGDQWYWDNLSAPELADDPCDGVSVNDEIIMDFECQQNLNFTFSQSGINFRRILNPDQSGANTSDYVAMYIRNGEEEDDVIIARPNVTGIINILSGDIIYLNVWDPGAPTNVRVSLQSNPDDGNAVTEIIGVDAMTTASNTWETLTYDVSSVAGSTVNQIVILFDPGNFTADEYYWDNLSFTEPTTSTVEQLKGVNNFIAYPNPTQEITTFEYDLNISSEVNLTIYDLTGKPIETVFNGTKNPGHQKINWNAGAIANGIYFYTLSINGQIASGKLTILK
ncbi:MAG: T9SS type A sorting domain-containing protein [Saprospiraceae bacterium]|nr:T9SS type A sorting domain-containing protein [Saprospiraceae bacterium]